MVATVPWEPQAFSWVFTNGNIPHSWMALPYFSEENPWHHSHGYPDIFHAP